MKHQILKILVLWLAFSFLVLSAKAQSPEQQTLSKNGSGIITKISLTLTLQSNSFFDTTQSLIPDASRLVSDSFSMAVNEKGVGTFQGNIKIISPAEKPIFVGYIHGTVGITSVHKKDKGVSAPGHLEGMLEIMPPGDCRGQNRQGTPQVFEVNFTADEITESASPVPRYKAHLDGIISPSFFTTQENKVTIESDKKAYDVKDSILGIISNGFDHPIQVFDEESYCTIVQLQRQEVDRWGEVAGCPLDRPPLPVRIEAGETKKVTLPPEAFGSAPKPPGIYRLSLTYFNLDGNGKLIGSSITTVSPIFTVNAPSNSGSVTLTTDKSSYRVDEKMAVSVHNDTKEAIQTEDHHSFCSIVVLQRKNSDSWTDTASCLLLSPTRLITIPAGQALEAILPLASLGAKIEPGMYRIEFSYTPVDSNGNAIGSRNIIYSPELTVLAASRTSFGFN